MTWHIDPRTLEAYVHGDLDFSRVASVELHVEACALCRTSLARSVGHVEPLATSHERSWAELLEVVDRPRRNWVERLLLRCGVSASTTRLVASTELLGAWWFACIGVLLCAGLLAMLGASVVAVAVFLVAAPLLPVVAVGFAYGVAGEPAREMSTVAPYSSARRLLIRTLTALTATLPFAGIVSLALPTGVHLVLWLLPALALVCATLALCSFTTAARASTAVALGWLAVCHTVLLPVRRGSLALLIEAVPPATTTGQLVLLVGGLAALVLTVARRDRFEQVTRA